MTDDADLERRFGGLRRLHGDAAYERLRGARIAIVGLGGVGSWAAEALARSGVAELTLIDLDHVSEGNINRQIQATGQTIGQSKVLALCKRLADIHPGCVLRPVEDFVAADNWPALLTHEIDALIDACDQVRAKATLAAWAVVTGTAFVTVGAAGGKQRPQAVEVADLADTTHDPLLASLRQRLRQHHGAARTGRIGVNCVYSREAVRQPPQSCDTEGNLNCHGYGSSVTVTATFGMVAASEAMREVLARSPAPQSVTAA
ncbi:MAG: tRNA threonylcarbamoyladenosine dehydratase [Burkholderiaceae bacterium]|nr:tRNA threonylcarbamoyladenosine dehydratase [Burkholderiaceae bacterium]